MLLKSFSYFSLAILGFSTLAFAEEPKAPLAQYKAGSETMEAALLPNSRNTFEVKVNGASLYNAQVISTSQRHVKSADLGAYNVYDLTLIINGQVEYMKVALNERMSAITYSLPLWHESALAPTSMPTQDNASYSLFDDAQLVSIHAQTRELLECNFEKMYKITVTNPEKDMIAVFLNNGLKSYSKMLGAKFTPNATKTGGEFRFNLGNGLGLILNYDTANKENPLTLSYRGLKGGDVKCDPNLNFNYGDFLNIVSRKRL